MSSGLGRRQDEELKPMPLIGRSPRSDCHVHPRILARRRRHPPNPELRKRPANRTERPRELLLWIVRPKSVQVATNRVIGFLADDRSLQSEESSEVARQLRQITALTPLARQAHGAIERLFTLRIRSALSIRHSIALELVVVLKQRWAVLGHWLSRRATHHRLAAAGARLTFSGLPNRACRRAVRLGSPVVLLPVEPHLRTKAGAGILCSRSSYVVAFFRDTSTQQVPHGRSSLARRGTKQLPGSESDHAGRRTGRTGYQEASGRPLVGRGLHAVRDHVADGAAEGRAAERTGARRGDLAADADHRADHGAD